MDPFEGDDEMDDDIAAMPSHSTKVAPAPELITAASSSSSTAANPAVAPAAEPAKQVPKVKKYKKIIRIKYVEETVEDDQGYFVTQRKEIKEEIEVTDDEDDEKTRKRPTPSMSTGANKKQKKSKQGGLMGFFKKKWTKCVHMDARIFHFPLLVKTKDFFYKRQKVRFINKL